MWYCGFNELFPYGNTTIAEMQDRMSKESKRASDTSGFMNVVIRGSMITEYGVADLEECRRETS